MEGYLTQWNASFDVSTATANPRCCFFNAINGNGSIKRLLFKILQKGVKCYELRPSVNRNGYPI